MLLSLFFLCIGFGVALATTPLVIELANRGFGVDKADEERKRHKTPVSRLGGAPILLAILIPSVLVWFLVVGSRSIEIPVVVGAILMFGLGFWDDIKRIGARKKLAGQFLIATVVYVLGLKIDQVTYPGQNWSLELGFWSYPVTVIWLVALPNIINLIDGFDGLASGLGMFMAMTLGIVGLLANHWIIAFYAFSLAGALLGFLAFNFPPAKIFLGDGGAYLIGFCVAGLSASSHKGSVAAVMMVTMVVLGIPILDTALAILRRGLRGLPLFRADDEHLHHKIEDLGFSKPRIVLGAYAVCVVLSVVGLSIVWSQGKTIPIAIGTIFLMVLFVMRYVHLIRSWSDLRHKLDLIISRRRAVRYALLQAELMEHEIERYEDARSFWPIFEDALERIGFVPSREIDTAVFLIELGRHGSPRWKLAAPRNQGTKREWQQIAECLYPVYLKAKKKWPE